MEEKKKAHDASWWRWVGLAIFGMHLLLTLVFLHARVEYVLADAFFIGLTLGGPGGQRFSFLFLPFYLAGYAYDSFHFFTQFRQSAVHIADLYGAELTLFGVTTAEGSQILAEFFTRHHWAVLDCLSGCAYLLYMIEPPLFGIYLFFRDQTRMSRLGWAFFLLNLAGLFTFLVYPAAPPWYVEQHGMSQPVMEILPNPAGAIRFDALLGLEVYTWVYSRAATVFGAMPSLHVAYPVLVLCAAIGMGRRWVIGTALFAILVAFSAVYLNHHYILDILAGIGYAIVAFIVVAMLQWAFPASVLYKSRVVTESE